MVAVNRAEAEFWKRSQGYRVDWSDRLLGFECGGQQWVSEVAMPCGTIERPDGSEIRFMRELLALVEAAAIPAPAPIEQRWTARSRARMSPVRHMIRAMPVSCLCIFRVLIVSVAGLLGGGGRPALVGGDHHVHAERRGTAAAGDHHSVA